MMDPVQMYWDGHFEEARESHYCHKCECDIGWRDTVSAIPGRFQIMTFRLRSTNGERHHE